MKKAITVSMLGVILLAISIYEIIAVNNFINDFENTAIEIYETLENNKDKIDDYFTFVNNKKEKWNKQEKSLCLMFSYRDLTTINDCFSRLVAYVKNNDYDNACAEAELLLSYSEYNKEIMQLSFQNLF